MLDPVVISLEAFGKILTSRKARNPAAPTCSQSSSSVVLPLASSWSPPNESIVEIEVDRPLGGPGLLSGARSGLGVIIIFQQLLKTVRE